MEPLWHKVVFEHECGLEGTILEICVDREGNFCISGVCAVCGQEFEETNNLVELISKSAVSDYLESEEQPQLVVVKEMSKGRPN
jgi:hypothetical protein